MSGTPIREYLDDVASCLTEEAARDPAVLHLIEIIHALARALAEQQQRVVEVAAQIDRARNAITAQIEARIDDVQCEAQAEIRQLRAQLAVRERQARDRGWRPTAVKFVEYDAEGRPAALIGETLR